MSTVKRTSPVSDLPSPHQLPNLPRTPNPPPHPTQERHFHPIKVPSRTARAVKESERVALMDELERLDAQLAAKKAAKVNRTCYLRE